MNDKDIKQLFNACDQDGDGQIDYKEFVEDIRDSFALRADDDGMADTDTNEYALVKF